ncbi:hypothetical protein [Thalassococcus sp. S3]|uniref:hypothetical protein n=1 Tax=Thalassococcus sp. S3 TaxID=2017482 RepID=UPI0015825498|nr:hypothetical protein [Thalassococcus sp. S3]
MPNAVAYLMLAIWPLICVGLFRKLPFERALIWSILGGYLVLPQIAEFNLPLVPDMDKVAIPNIAAFAICVFLLGRRVSFWPSGWPLRLLLIGFVFGVGPTVLTNRDPIIFEILANTDPITFHTGWLPGLSLRDLFSVISNQVIMLLPFFLARQFLYTETGMRELIYALFIGGLIYTIPALIEIRFSPQINIWIYGFFQHSFEQMMRNGGFRPIVFLEHALWVAFFFMTAIMSAAALLRQAEYKDRVRYGLLMFYLFGVLILCKSLASLAYCLALTPLVLFTPPKWQVRIAIAFAFVAVVYPVLRNAGMVPLDDILALAGQISADRQQSLGFRFENEEQLLARAHDRWLFGWGGWGRNLIRDVESGQILSIPDGRWIIVFGTFGWVGYVSEMGLLALPLILLGWHLRKADATSIPPYVAPLALMLAITMVDMLLNAILTPFTWLLAGTIYGYVEHARGARRDFSRTQLFPDGPAIGRKDRSEAPRTLL